VIESESEFKSVRGGLPSRKERARIIDQDIDPCCRVEQSVGKSANLVRPRKVGIVDFYSNARQAGAQAADGAVAFVTVAPNEHQPSAKCAKLLCSLKPDPAGRASDNAGFPSCLLTIHVDLAVGPQCTTLENHYHVYTPQELLLE
jgi:hypothetical protein